MAKLFHRMAGVMVVALLAVAPTFADTVFTGTVFYTNFTGGPDVNKVSYSYDATTQTLTVGTAKNIASTPGADGIIFDPANNLLVGGQGSGQVYEVNPSNGSFTGVAPGSPGQDQNSFHLALNPDGKSLYTSDFGGPLDTVPLPFGTQGTTTTISGGDSGVTQVAFAPNGNVFYDNSQPNCCGDVGLINLSTGVTTRLYTGLTPAHGLIFDPFTGLITMFGAGFTGTIDQNGNNLKVSPSPFACDFDQGAPDGKSHAFAAGCGELTFLDYSTSHDITNPDKVIVVGGFGGIDDVAPLSGAGSSTVPEPSSLLLLGTGLLGLIVKRRRH